MSGKDVCSLGSLCFHFVFFSFVIYTIESCQEPYTVRYNEGALAHHVVEFVIGDKLTSTDGGDKLCRTNMLADVTIFILIQIANQ